MQSCPELRLETVDYFEQDMNHQLLSQTAETLAIIVDMTADARAISSLKSLLTEVKHHDLILMIAVNQMHCMLCRSLCCMSVATF